MTVVAIAAQPRPAARWSASANGRPVRNTAAIGQLVGAQVGKVVGEEGRLLGGPGRGGDALGELAPATHGGDGIPSLRNGSSQLVPGGLVGTSRRPPPARAREPREFLRWYSDAEVARLTRYQDGPMRPDEIERFFAARALGPESLSLAVHVRDSDRLIGTCALSQLDSDNGSALFHITIGEKDTWGRGYGTEATRLMLDHAFGTLNLHRIGLSVFSFNERAIRSYRSCGFVIEGRAREAIWRDGQLVGRGLDERPPLRLGGDPQRSEPVAGARSSPTADGSGAAPAAGIFGRRR